LAGLQRVKTVVFQPIRRLLPGRPLAKKLRRGVLDSTGVGGYPTILFLNSIPI
jgi:hypothetical protein